VDLHVDLALPRTTVTAKLHFRQADQRSSNDLILDGKGLELLNISLNDVALRAGEYSLTDENLTVFAVPTEGELTVVTGIKPGAGVMEGLVYLEGAFVTHCEPAGFRRITYFPDRPDVLARYRCTLEADVRSCPVLLSNGHLVDTGQLPGNRHFATWEDPYPKASYLFAIAAGSFGKVTDSFETRSGREVQLAVYAATQDLPRCRHGLEVLKEAMAWDEENYGREYDLDVLNIVVLRSYPGGAMENKGLNLYTSEFFLTSPETSTDEELRRVEATIAHEYFHNWSGNRVGCRSWFELSLKEGFTIFRQQEFMAAFAGPSIARIDEVIRLRDQQYPEDDGGMAHAVRPDSYLSVNNLYTRTVYEKGAELIRMLKVLLGTGAYIRSVNRFFQQYDGCATTIEAFIATMEEVSGRDLGQFRHWYEMVGASNVTVTGTFDRSQHSYTLTVRQCLSKPESQPLQMPLCVALLGPEGRQLPLRLTGEQGSTAKERVLELRSEVAEFVFEEIDVRPVPSLFRGHSAPVRVSTDLTDDDILHLALSDSDDVNRWDAAQQLGIRAVLARLGGDNSDHSQNAWFCLFRRIIDSPDSIAGMAGRMLQLPGQRLVGQHQDEIDVDGIWLARRELSIATAHEFREQLSRCYERLGAAAEQPDGFEARKLRNLCLWYLMRTCQSDFVAECWAQWDESRLLENCAAAFHCLVERGDEDRDRVLCDAYRRWQHAPALIDRWFAIQAAAESDDCARRVRRLTAHTDYSPVNATRLKALFDTFLCNQAAFHHASGDGYTVVIDTALSLNRSDPRLAARFLKGFGNWQRVDRARREMIAASLQRVLETDGLAADLFDAADRLLTGSTAGARGNGLLS
jgi:aminopeptidase N